MIVVSELFLNIALINTVSPHAKLLTVWHNGAKLQYPEYPQMSFVSLIKFPGLERNEGTKKTHEERGASRCVCSPLHCGKHAVSWAVVVTMERATQELHMKTRKPSPSLCISLYSRRKQTYITVSQEAALCVCSSWYIIHNWGFDQDVLEKHFERQWKLQWVPHYHQHAAVFQIIYFTAWPLLINSPPAQDIKTTPNLQIPGFPWCTWAQNTVARHQT